MKMGSSFGNIELRRFAGTRHHAEHLDEPIRVAHITDQHVGRVTPLPIQMEAIAEINEAAPDVVLITGDFVCHSQAYLQDLSEVIAALDAPTFAVLGNHDHWSGSQGVRKALFRGGAEILDNANTILKVRHQALQLVGIDDAYTGHADVERAVRGIRPDLPTIGLSHIGEMADRMWAHGISLVLSGHTHAGQITVANLHRWTAGKLAGHKYIHGLYGERATDGALYVGAGIGAAVMPLRIGERSRREVTLFELGHAPGTLDEHHEEQLALPGRPVTEERAAKRRKAVVKKRAKRVKRNGKNGEA
jgi:predicted MPP superfamily phosphohydrolase